MISAERFSNYRIQHDLTQDDLGYILGITGKYVGMIERGGKEVGEESSLGILFQIIERFPPGPKSEWGNRSEIGGEGDFVARPDLPSGQRTIPVLGWAHAGDAASYEEIAADWQDRVPTECRDPKAFAVRLEGDSMEPKYSEGDLLILQPSEEIFSGCLAVLKLTNDGIIFRRVERRGEQFRLVPLNQQYGVEEISKEMVAWIYPVWGMWRQVWKK